MPAIYNHSQNPANLFLNRSKNGRQQNGLLRFQGLNHAQKSKWEKSAGIFKPFLDTIAFL